MFDLQTIENQLSTAIGQQETSGGTAGVGSSLNNPGAIKYAPWESAYGAVPAPNGFAMFPTQAGGFAAMKALIDKYVQAGASPSSLINAWAPASDGNSNNASRIDQITGSTGLNPNTPINAQASGTAPINAQSSGLDVAISKLLGIYNPSTPVTVGGLQSAASSGGSLWSRIAAFLLGFVFIALGIAMLKQTQIVINNVKEAATNVAGTAAKVAAIS